MQPKDFEAAAPADHAHGNCRNAEERDEKEDRFHQGYDLSVVGRLTVVSSAWAGRCLKGLPPSERCASPEDRARRRSAGRQVRLAVDRNALGPMRGVGDLPTAVTTPL